MSLLYDPNLENDFSYVVNRYAMPTLGWCVFYFVFYFFVKRIIFPKIPFIPSKVRSDESKQLVVNTTISFFNSILQSILTIPLWCFVFFGQIALYEHYIHSFVCCFLGYNIYDSISGVIFEKAIVFRRQPALVVHHIVVTSSLIGSLFSPYTMYYQVIATLCEVNSIFLHARTILKLCEPKFAFQYSRIVLVGQYLTYLTFRLPTSAWLVPEGIRYSTNFSTTYFWAILAVLLFLLNILYFILIIKSDLRQVRPTMKQ